MLLVVHKIGLVTNILYFISLHGESHEEKVKDRCHTKDKKK